MVDHNTNASIFDNARQRKNRQRRQKLLAQNPDADFLSNLIADDILARLELVTRSFSKVIIIGNCPPSLFGQLSKQYSQVLTIDLIDPTWSEKHICCHQWDMLPALPFTPDLVITIGILDLVNDLPGFLIQLRKAMQPDGLLLAGFWGAGSLSTLKRAMLIADGERPTAHVHPQIDVRAVGDLLSRAGFAMPVADLDNLTMRYSNVRRLLSDIRLSGSGNALAGPILPYGKVKWHKLQEYLNRQTDSENKFSETFALISLSGWSPSPDQPKPARRGSGQVSLASELKKTKS